MGSGEIESIIGLYKTWYNKDRVKIAHGAPRCLFIRHCLLGEVPEQMQMHTKRKEVSIALRRRFRTLIDPWLKEVRARVESLLALRDIDYPYIYSPSNPYHSYSIFTIKSV